MHSYMVQYHGTINWSASEPAAAPMKRSLNTKPDEIEFQLNLNCDEQEVDHTFITLIDDENTTTGFDMNIDLVKMFNANKSNIYTLINGDIQSAANCLPISNQATVIPVGVQIAEDGEYTFSMPDGTSGIGVTLIDNETGERTSLSALDYTINLTAGSYENRFVLEISPINETPTSIEPSVSVTPHAEARKVCIDGILYIVREGKIYDARGIRVE